MTTPQSYTDISSRIMEFSHVLRAENNTYDARRLEEMAATIELMSPALQRCWGGPLNGQMGRRAMMLELLARINFDAIIETGTYRGVSTEWFAQNFDKAVYSCELARLYFLQAQHRLARYSNVTLGNMKSDAFLIDYTKVIAPQSRVLVYLDAHWNKELPLTDEIRIILDSGLKAVFVIDDFQVPGDTGYRFDDYGPGNRLVLDLLHHLDRPDFRFYFPTLPAHDETGACRGVWVFTNCFNDQLEHCTLLKGDTWQNWQPRLVEAGQK